MEVVMFSTFSTMIDVTALCVNFMSFKLLQSQMRFHLARSISRIFSTANNSGEAKQPEPAYISSEHIEKYLHKPTTSTQKRIKNKMNLEWYGCFCLALFVYINSEDILPGSWLSDNMWMDFHDKYPHRVNKIMQQNERAIPRKYTISKSA